MLKKRISVVAAAVAAALLIACGEGDQINPGDLTTGSGNAPPVTVVTTAPAQPGGAAAPNDPARCQSLEGCFDQNGMKALYDVVIQNLVAFAGETYTSLPMPNNWYFIASGTTGTSACDDRVSKPTDLAYCPADLSVYIGQDAYWKMYSQMGDAAVFVPTAHELGHHVQRQAGVPNKQGREGIPQENQADCFAGAFFKWAQAKGYVENDDTTEMSTVLVAAGEAESVDRSHGTVQERGNSFLMGYQGGVAACNSFFPATPLIS